MQVKQLNSTTMESSTVPVISFSQMVDNFWIPGFFSIRAFRSALKYVPRDDDVFIVTYPKSGTTWAQHILLLIYKQGQPIADYFEFKSRSPFLEFEGAKAAEIMTRPGAIKVHLPYHLSPQSDKAKYIYLARNPKDCLVSYYFHMKNMPCHNLEGSFDDFFEMFHSGNIDFGDYYDNLLGWYKRRNNPNVLFMTYEEMKADHKSAILKMASFVDDEKFAQPLRNDPDKLNNVLHYSSFDYMQNIVNKGTDEMFAMKKEFVMKDFFNGVPEIMKESFTNRAEAIERQKDKPLKPCNFIRRGIVGDWRNYLSEEQSKRMDEKFVERTKGTDISNLWINMM